MNRPSVLILIFSVYVCLVQAQQISNVHAEEKSQRINVYYDLSGEGAFEIKIYLSLDGGEVWEMLQDQISGAVGQQQFAGSGKKIKWDVREAQDKPEVSLDYQVEASNEQTISRAGTFTDKREGKMYRWVQIGNQLWMEENLNYKTASGSWCYDDLKLNCNIFGRLYDWENAQIACPDGWQLPSDADWTELISFLGGDNVAGGKMKANGTSNWITPNTEATNISGFTALPGGFRSGNSYFYSKGSYAYFWSSSEINATRAWKRGLYYNYGNVSNLSYGKDYGFSVRCLKK